MNFKVLIGAIFASTIIVAGCSSESGSGGTGGNGDGGNGGDAKAERRRRHWRQSSRSTATPTFPTPRPTSSTTTSVEGNIPETTTDDCTGETLRCRPRERARPDLNVRGSRTPSPGDVICMAPGTYEMEHDHQASQLVSEGLTLKGTGASRLTTRFSSLEARAAAPASRRSEGRRRHREPLRSRTASANGIEQQRHHAARCSARFNVSWDDACDQATPRLQYVAVTDLQLRRSATSSPATNCRRPPAKADSRVRG